MKRLLMILLLGLLLFGCASADTMSEYTLSPFTFDTQAMLALTFGDRVADAWLEDEEHSIYRLPDTETGPYCSMNDVYSRDFGQMDIYIYTAAAEAEKHEPGMRENVEPSGVAKCALSTQEAQAKAEAWLAELGVTDAYLQSVTAYGRVTKLPGGYMFAFGQSLDGVPVYWAAALFEQEEIIPQSNRIEITIGDSGLIRVQGWWSAFTPTGKPIDVLSTAEAIAAFTAVGEQADDAELCYLLTSGQGATKALPAYRFQNRFISAVDGTVLQ